jgi:hypothetical protein
MNRGVFLIVVLLGVFCEDSYSQSQNKHDTSLREIYDDLNKCLKQNTDSLGLYNIAYTNKLLYYTRNYGSTITNEFDPSGTVFGGDNVKIYNLEGYEVGHLGYHSICQYRPYNKDSLVSVLLSHKDEQNKNHSGYRYTLIKEFYWKNNLYFLATFYGTNSYGEEFKGLKIYTIDKGVLDDTIAMIKTDSGLKNEIIFNSALFRLAKSPDIMKESIYFDRETKTIYVPKTALNKRGEAMPAKGYIEYKFKDGYFFKVE